MKKVNLKLMAVLVGASLLFASCGSDTASDDNTSHHPEGMKHDETGHNHGDAGEARNVTANTGTEKGDLTAVLNAYFSMNENLASDDASSAAKSSEKLGVALKSFKGSNLSDADQKEVGEILESAREHAEHISANAGEIAHQREHLVSLSIDIKDLIAIIGTSQKLYEDFCPMADDNQGAIWISNKEEISNPFMGSKMPKCGKINRVIN